MYTKDCVSIWCAWDAGGRCGILRDSRYTAILDNAVMKKNRDIGRETGYYLQKKKGLYIHFFGDLERNHTIFASGIPYDIVSSICNIESTSTIGTIFTT